MKRKARAQASMDSEPVVKRLRVPKKTRQVSRRAPLSTHLAMKEEARAKQQAEEVSRATGFISSFLQDLVLLDSVYDRAEIHVKEELPFVPTPYIDLPRVPVIADEETLERILQDEHGDVCKGVDSATSALEALASMSDGKTSPVDVGESWDSLELGDYWLPTDQPGVNFEPFIGDEDVFVADV
ncbi:unnamed protein product [Peronospora belbahrii]|uniref:Uncharacterized protein n=1 Tax=Peronospora belbahrii TaxID=622444 RepID=A0AAU9KS41_9STRA|nr:unnamed protein product [Peronospora belbahrii]CAH0517836.1 unnamed protein product [Peronospora belbahrii]